MVSLIDRMTQDEFEVFVAQSMKRMSCSIAECNQEWDFPCYRHWSLKGDVLTLSDGHLPPIRCQVQVVGDHHTDHNYWRWSWCFIDFRRKEIRDMALVKAFGHQHRITDLTLNSMGAGEGGAWELAAVAANLLGAMSVYAAVKRSRILFLLIKSVQFASVADPNCRHCGAQNPQPSEAITSAGETISGTSARSVPGQVKQPRDRFAEQKVGAALVRRRPAPLRLPPRSS
jgi:hypothetical protein